MRISRKKFIALLFISLVGAFFGSWYMNFSWIVRGILMRDLGELNIESGIIDQYLADSSEVNKWDMFTVGKKFLILAHFFFNIKIIRLPYYHKYLHYKNIICGDFLLSTNYFNNWKGDADKPISYLGLFNPYQRYCFNPFAKSISLPDV